MLRNSLVLGFSALLVLGAAPLHAQYDQIFMKSGAPVRGKITEMGREEVAMEMSGPKRTFQVNEIIRITYNGEPNELTNARNAVFQRNYNAALTELKKLEGQPQQRDLIQQDIDFYRALSLARQAMSEGGDKAAAMTALLNFARSAPKNYHFYQAAEVLGDLAMASGKFSDAERFYQPLASAPWADYKMRANNAVARALVAQKKFAEALQRFEEVIGSDLPTAEATSQKLQAITGKAVCLAETGKPDEGIALLADIIAKEDTENKELFARTYNALGVCHLKAGRTKDALHAFLHTELLYFEVPEAHAEALYHLSKLWGDVNKSDRAIEARNTLRERYAGSVWASLE